MMVLCIGSRRAATLGVLTLAACAGAVSADVRLRAGPVYRDGMKTEISGGSHVQSLNLTTGQPFKRLPDGVGAIGAYANRTYDNGYVNRDPGTGNPASIDPNTTWFWGYQNDSQYSQAQGTLTFSRDGGRQVSREVMSDRNWKDDNTFDGWGVEFAAEWSWTKLAGVDVALMIGLRGFPDVSASHNGTSYRERITNRDFTVVDTYNVAGTAIPAAPHAGTYDGPFDMPAVIPSPVIPNLPQSRQETTRRLSVSESYNHVDMDIDSNLYEFRMGPVFSRTFHDGDVRASVAPVVTLNVLDQEARRDESWITSRSDGSRETLRRWHDRASDSDLLLGVGVQAAAEFKLSAVWGLALTAAADWVESSRMQVGPNSVKTDVSGFTLGVSVVRTFGGADGK